MIGLAGVLAPNILAADNDSPYRLTEKQMGPYDVSAHASKRNPRNWDENHHRILSGVFDRYPALKIILGHRGELIPYYLPRLEDRMPPRLTGLKRRITDYFIEDFHISSSGLFDYRQLQLCIQMIGVERILYAVDYPIMNLAKARPFLENAPIPDADKHKIAYQNAERLLRI